MTIEKEWMAEVVNGFHQEKGFAVPGCLRTTPQGRAQLKYQTLVAGFGIRTFSVLAGAFPRFSEALGEARWHKVGRQFSLKVAKDSPQLGQLPDLFFEYCQDLVLGEHERHALEKDWGAFRLQRSFYDGDRVVKKVEDLEVDPRLSLQQSLVVLNLEGIVLSRDSEDDFECPVDPVTIGLLERLEGEVFTPTGVAEALGQEAALAKFISNGLTFKWFCLEP